MVLIVGLIPSPLCVWIGTTAYKPVAGGEGKEGENNARAALAESLAKAQEVRFIISILLGLYPHTNAAAI